jgi:hypothetical protein
MTHKKLVQAAYTNELSGYSPNFRPKFKLSDLILQVNLKSKI